MVQAVSGEEQNQVCAPAPSSNVRCFTPDVGAAPIRGAIRRLGVALPDDVLHNQELEERLGLPAGWIVERSGIMQRRVGDRVGSLAAEAATLALAGHASGDVDLLILATSTPDARMPATAADVARRLGLRCATFDLNAACAGFVYALLTAYGFLAIGARTVLVVGADVMTRLVDPHDRGTAILFGDGAGAAILSRDDTDSAGALLGWHAGSEPSRYDLLYATLDAPLVMDGRAVFRHAVHTLVESSAAAIAAAGVTADDIALFVPHQANARIIGAACERLDIAAERVVSTIATTGNTSAASVPIALCGAVSEDRLTRGDLVLLSGFGAGMTSASAVVQW